MPIYQPLVWPTKVRKDNESLKSQGPRVHLQRTVVNTAANSNAAAFVKAATRDVKAYLRSKSYNALTTYSAVDGGVERTELADYLVCGSTNTSIDIYGLNSYAGCGATSVSAYSSLNNAFANFPIPAFFSEFGCLNAGTRTWSEVPIIFSNAQMTQIWSGGSAFEVSRN